MNMVVLSGALQMYFLLLIFDDGNWWQAEASIVLLAGAVEVNSPAQGTLRRFTQWPNTQPSSWKAHTLPLS